MALLLLLVASLLVAATGKEAIPGVVKARAFHVVARDGTVLVKLSDSIGMGRGWAGTIETYDGKGRTLLTVAATGAGSALILALNSEGEEDRLVTISP